MTLIEMPRSRGSIRIESRLSVAAWSGGRITSTAPGQCRAISATPSRNLRVMVICPSACGTAPIDGRITSDFASRRGFDVEQASRVIRPPAVIVAGAAGRVNRRARESSHCGDVVGNRGTRRYDRLLSDGRANQRDNAGRRRLLKNFNSMSQVQRPSLSLLSADTLKNDLVAGLVVFLAALPLCLGVASASNAPYFAGVLAGIVGGLVVGVLSGSHTSVSGPSPGLTAIVLAQMAALGSFHAFLLAVVVAGLIQIVLGVARAGFVAAFFPSSVIKGLLAAIGLLLILKQAPHMLGWDADPEGDMSFFQPDNENTFSELWKVAARIQPGAAAVGLVSLAILIAWENWKLLKKVPVPAPLVVVLFGAAGNLFL